jgi:iron complex outermembrane receptor protein
MLDNRLTIDASAFDIEWTDIQLQVTSLANLGYTVNGGKARIQGIEAAGELVLDGGWRLTGNTAIMHGELRQDFPNVPGAATGLLAFRGDQLPGSTRFTANVGVEKAWNVLSDYVLTVGGNLSHTGDRASEFRNAVAAANKRSRFKIPAWEQIDLFATLSNGEWTVNGYIRNAGSKHGLIRADDSGGRVATMSGAFIAPQTIGLNIARNF